MFELLVFLQIIFSRITFQTNVALVSFAIGVMSLHVTSKGAESGEGQMAEVTDANFTWKGNKSFISRKLDHLESRLKYLKGLEIYRKSSN